MSEQTIEFEHFIDGVLTPVTSVVLANDPDAPTFGARRVSTGEVIAAAGVALSADTGAAGRYTITLTDLVPGELYQYGLVWVYNGGTDAELKTFAAPGPAGDAAAGLYATQADVVDLIALDNLQITSDLEGQTTVNVARVQRGLTWSDGVIHRELRHLFNTPIDGMDGDTTSFLAEISARLCAWWLFQNRGIRDMDPVRPVEGVAGVLEAHRKLAMDSLAEIRGDAQRIVATRRGVPRGPVGAFAARRSFCIGAGGVYAAGPLPPFGPFPPPLGGPL